MLNKKFLPIVLLTTVLAVVALAGYLLPEDGKAVPTRIAMQNTGGPVVFEHSKHIEDVPSCMTCHHDMSHGAAEPMACNDCHGIAVVDAAFVADHQKSFARESCAVCHHYQPGRQDWGHDRHSMDFGLECASCHHEDTSIEPEPANCADCHEAGAAPTGKPAEEGIPPNFADAVHSKCAACHQEWFDLKARGCEKCHFDKVPEGEVPAARKHANLETMSCKSCHEQAPDKLIPGRMQAHHASCMGCHNELGKGPRTNKDCKQCHM